MRTQFTIIGGLLAMDGGWLMLAGLPLASVSLAVCLVALSHGKGLRILAGLIVIVSGLLLAGYGVLTDIFELGHMSDDPRPWCFIAGLFIAALGISVPFWTPRDSNQKNSDKGGLAQS